MTHVTLPACPIHPLNPPIPPRCSTLALSAPLAGLRLGMPEDDYFAVADAEIHAAVQAAAQTLEDLGAQIEPVHLPPELAELFRAYRSVQMPEATATHRPA